jgi:hypothetical protein
MDLAITIAPAAALIWVGVYMWRLDRHWPYLMALKVAEGRYSPDFVRRHVNIVRGLIFVLGALCLFGAAYWLSVRL